MALAEPSTTTSVTTQPQPTHISTISAANTGIPPHNDLRSSLTAINDLRFFLATAPVNWQENQVIRRYFLNDTLGFVSCVCWNKLFYITGTDIVKVCLYIMLNFGREIHHKKKFEEGIFSDLRNLKCGVDAVLEQPKSDFLAFLFKNMCLKTQKKQKVFFWFSVPHEKLFSDALERDLKRETLHQTCCTTAVGVPATSFRFDFTSSMPLHEQLDQFFRQLERSLEKEPAEQRRSSVAAAAAHTSQPPRVEEPIDDIRNEQESNLDDDDEYDDPTEQVLPSNNHSNAASHSAAYEAAVEPEIRPQVLVVEKQNGSTSGELLPDRETQNRSRRSLLDDRASQPGEEDFPLDYFPVSIEYPGRSQTPAQAVPQPQQPVALPLPPEFAAQFQQGYGAPLAQAYPAILSPSLSVPLATTLAVPQPVPQPQAQYEGFQEDGMTNGEFYEASRRGAFSPLPVQREENTNPDASASGNASGNGNGAAGDDIQYEVRGPLPTLPPSRSGTSLAGGAPAGLAGAGGPPAGVYGNPLYSSFFFPQPYTSASQEFANYDGAGNYFPEDYVPYSEAPVLPSEALQPGQPQPVVQPQPIAQPQPQPVPLSHSSHSSHSSLALDPARAGAGSTFSRPSTSAAASYGSSRGHSRASSITAQKRVGKPQRFTPGHQRQFSHDRLAQYVDGRGQFPQANGNGSANANGMSSETSQDESFGDM